MGPVTRLRGPADKIDENNQLARVPRKNKANDGQDSILTARESLRNINNSAEETLQSEARGSRKQMQVYIETFASEDKAKTKPQLLDTLTSLRKDFFINYRMLEKAEKTKSKLESSLVKLNNEHSQLKKDHVQLQENFDSIDEKHNERMKALQTKLTKAIAAKKRERSGMLLEVSSGVVKEIKKQAKGWIFSMVKFIQSEEEMITATKLLFRLGKFDTHLVDTKEKRAQMVETYKVILKKNIFLQRNYVTAETKKMFMKHLSSPNGQPFTVEDLLMCLQRKVKSESDMKKFKIYWDEFLPKAVGSLAWSENVRLYTTICQAMRKDYPDMPLITPDDEAFMVIVMHNAMDRWMDEYKKAVEKSQAKAEGRESSEEGSEEDQEDKKPNQYDGLFTRTTEGQNHWGGWQSEGLELFIEYRAMNVAARKLPNCAKVEMDCLQLLREERGIEASCESAQEHAKNKEAKKRMKKRGLVNATLPPKKKVVCTLALPSDTSDDEHEKEETFSDEE